MSVNILMMMLADVRARLVERDELVGDALCVGSIDGSEHTKADSLAFREWILQEILERRHL